MASKYGNRKVFANGQTFDSRREANRWCELIILQRAGKISELQRQVPFELIPPQRRSEKKGIERGVRYMADFVYNKNGKTIVEDAKGVRTKEYIIKRKLMLWLHGIEIMEV